MLPLNKRQNELLTVIQNSSSVYVKDLISQFDVSAATIRKDLTYLENMGLVKRSHGEVHASSKNELAPFQTRTVLNSALKQAIAASAVELIEYGSSIILDSGTTTYEIAKLLTERTDLTILTNSLLVANLLAPNMPNVSLAGGILLGENLSTQGPETENYFRSVEVDIAFIGASGVRGSIGLASLSSLECSVKRTMIQAGRRVCAVFDSSKFQKSAIHLFADFDQFDYVISDTAPHPPALQERLSALPLQWIVASV